MAENGKRRVVITGLGAVTPIGNSVPELWDSILHGRSGAGLITRFDASTFDCKIACEVKNFALGDFISKRDAGRLDTPSKYAIQAAYEALKDSGLDMAKEDRTRIGAIIGIGLGGIVDIEEQHTRFMEKGAGRLSPYLVPKMMPNAAVANVAIIHGLQGPCYSTNSACAASANGILDAYYTILRDEADVIVTGGVEETISVLGIGGFAAMKALSTRNADPLRASRPFDKDRDGFVMGDGSGILIFEEYERAKARGAKIYAEFIGGASTCDAFHISAPEPTGEGGVRCMKLCLKYAGASPSEVDYINAHGTSTLYNDRTETKVIKETFGETDARRIAISSTKSMTGHLLGGAAAIEAVISTLAIKNKVVPPTTNYETPDPDCDLDYTPNTPRDREIREIGRAHV